MEYRVRSRRSDEWVEKYKGSQVTAEMVNLLIRGPARVLKPDGKPLLVYLPGAVKDVADETYADFSKIRMMSDNRGYASGTVRAKRTGPEGHSAGKTENLTGTRTRATAVASGIIGSFEKTAAHPACRLTAFTAQQVEQWDRLQPMFRAIADKFEEHVPDRFAAQEAVVARTHADWVIKGTPFTTITVNNTYPTGIHTDKGDLDEGFSTLAVMRRGNFIGGWLTFPQFGISADMQYGDLLLMDAHEWHGNTPMRCARCQADLRKPNHRCEDLPAEAEFTSPERISIVSYYRTKMQACASEAEENALRAQTWEERTAAKLGIGGTGE